MPELLYNQVLGAISQPVLVLDEKFPGADWYLGTVTIATYEFETYRILDRLLLPRFVDKLKSDAEAQGIRPLKLRIISVTEGLKITYTIEFTAAGKIVSQGEAMGAIPPLVYLLVLAVIAVFGYLAAREIRRDVKTAFVFGSWGFVAAGVVAFLFLREVKK